MMKTFINYKIIKIWIEKEKYFSFLFIISDIKYFADFKIKMFLLVYILFCDLYSKIYNKTFFILK